MKKLIFVLFLPLNLIFAQSNEEEKPIDLTGKFALMFQIDQNFDLNSFQGMSFAGKYFFSDNLGVRLLFSTTYNKSDQSENMFYYLPDDQHSEELYYFTDAFSYKIATSLIYNLTNNEFIRFYLGCGPLISYTNSEFTNGSVEYAYTFSRGRQTKEYSLGLNFFLDIEWFVSKKISLSAEYGFEYSYTENEMSDKQFANGQLKNENNSKIDKKLFKNLPISLGVSIYF